MTKAFSLIVMQGGVPFLDEAPGSETPLNYTFCDLMYDDTGYGVYIVAAENIQTLRRLDAQNDNFIMLTQLSENENDKWDELNHPSSNAARGKVNQILVGHGKPTIPPGRANKEFITDLCQHHRHEVKRFDLYDFDIADMGA